MRIISGKNRGLKLTHIGAGDLVSHLRPTSDRVKENIFNLLENGKTNLSFESIRVLDLFAGTGSLGLEALSRGARHVTFFEKNKISLKLLISNISICNVEKLVEIRRCDLTNIIKNPDKKFDLVFLDPPYHSNLGEIAISNFLKEGWLSEDSIIVFESNKEILLKEFECLDCRKYGKTFVNVFRSMNN